MNKLCPQCDQRGVFGYRNRETGVLIWHCGVHRLGQHWANARLDQINNSTTSFQCDQPTTPHEPFVHPCEACGGFAYHGYGVNLRAGKEGKWYCADHRPAGNGQ